jgi:hypothetical protein
MTSRTLLRTFTLALTLAGCGDDSTETPFPGDVDCTACTETEACWYTTDFDGEVSDGGCVPLPAECAQDRSCGCIDAAQENTCTEDMQQNSKACEPIENIPVVECVSTLG